MRIPMARTIRAASIAGALLLAACSSSPDTPTGPTTVATTVPSVITTGTWAIATLMQRTEDKTSQFSGYVFSFSGSGAESGTVTATKGGNVVSGSWSHTAAVTYYGSTSKESIVLNFGATSPFDRVTGTWNVTASTSSSLTLASPEVLEDSHLVFVRQ